MPYLNCPRCTLAIPVGPDDAKPRSCPRCVGRDRIPIPMYATESRAGAGLPRLSEAPSPPSVRTD
jgi:hypothetical protein